MLVRLPYFRMPMFRRSRMASRQRLKHVIDSEGGLTSTPSVTTLANVVNSLDSASIVPTENVIGSLVNGIYLSLFIIGGTGAPVGGNQSWYIAKSRTGQTAVADFPDPDAVGNSQLRNQIFHQEKGLVGSGDGTAMAFKGVIVVPKGMRRMRLGDQFFVKIKNNGADDVQFCLQAHYNSYS